MGICFPHARNGVESLKERLCTDENKGAMKAERERQLWILCSVDANAREELILAYRPMVYWLARKLRAPYDTYSDLTQEGMIALINAVDAFDVTRNNRFSTYAYYKIRGRMINFLQRVEAKAPIAVGESVFEEEDLRASLRCNAADKTEWTVDLEAAMASLSEREAGVVHALVIEGRDAKEVARDIRVNVSHVYRIRRKAVAKMKKWLGLGETEATASA